MDPIWLRTAFPLFPEGFSQALGDTSFKSGLNLLVRVLNPLHHLRKGNPLRLRKAVLHV
jgi:hypothetical protein